MQHVVWGTAGHIDHGKTSLVRALTGVDCDRLPEEKERGITIELGFAGLEAGGVRLHFVDVPGHERLVHTMIAGAAGIDLALLVIAADEGVMPQTREHLEVIRFMGVSGGAVALTKIDLVEAEFAELAAEEVRDLLAPTAFAEVPVVPVSAHTGQGLAELRQVLGEQSVGVRPREVVDRPYREPVDRVFSLTGAGTVVTGTSLWGALETGSEVVIEPGGLSARVRRLHVQGEDRQRVEAGERVAANLVGVNRDAIRRGHQILSPGPWRPTRLVTIDLELLTTAPAPLEEGDEVEIHALAARAPGRVERLARRPLEPGGRANAQLRLQQPMLLFPGDRLILRRPAPVNTFAGARVLDAGLRRWRRRDAEALADLPSARNDERPRLLASWIDAEGLAGLSLPELVGRLGVLEEALQAPLGRLLEDGTILALPTQPPRFVATATIEALAADARTALRDRLAGTEVSAGIPARDFAGQVLPRKADGLAEIYLEELRRRGVLELSEGRVVPPGRDSHMTPAGEELTRRVESLYRELGFEAPSPLAVAEQLVERPASVESVCRYLVQRRRLVRLDGKFLVHRAVLDDVARKVRDWPVEAFGVADFKAKFGLTRKLAIPALEWLDSERVTVRHGDRRRIVRPQR